jgi:hypothetical protein
MHLRAREVQAFFRARVTNRLTLGQGKSSLHVKWGFSVAKWGGGIPKGFLGMKGNSPATKGNVSDQEFESLLQLASESNQSRPPRLLRSLGLKRRAPSSEDKNRRQEFDARHPN